MDNKDAFVLAALDFCMFFAFIGAGIIFLASDLLFLMMIIYGLLISFVRDDILIKILKKKHG